MRQWPNLKLKLPLRPSEYEWVQEAASRRGQEPEQYAVRLLQEAIAILMMQGEPIREVCPLSQVLEQWSLVKMREAGRQAAERVNKAVIDSILGRSKAEIHRSVEQLEEVSGQPSQPPLKEAKAKKYRKGYGG